MTGLRASPAELSLEPGVSGPARDSDLELGFMSRPAWAPASDPPCTWTAKPCLFRVEFLL